MVFLGSSPTILSANVQQLLSVDTLVSTKYCTHYYRIISTWSSPILQLPSASIIQKYWWSLSWYSVVLSAWVTPSTLSTIGHAKSYVGYTLGKGVRVSEITKNDNLCPSSKWWMKCACLTGQSTSPRLLDTVFVKPCTMTINAILAPPLWTSSSAQPPPPPPPPTSHPTLSKYITTAPIVTSPLLVFPYVHTHSTISVQCMHGTYLYFRPVLTWGSGRHL